MSLLLHLTVSIQEVGYFRETLISKPGYIMFLSPEGHIIITLADHGEETPTVHEYFTLFVVQAKIRKDDN